MTRQEALRIIKPESENPEALKQAFRRKAKEYHPDLNPGNEKEAAEVMKTINAAYDLLTECLGQWFDFSKGAEYTGPGLDEKIMEILKSIKHIPGIEIEVCGTWIWITGDTKPVKDSLKEKSFKFAAKKKSWYWRPAGYRRRGKGKAWDMDKIRTRYGSTAYQSEELDRVA